jgi:predicted signal transduction protein with EAL and GGDEF domain
VLPDLVDVADAVRAASGAIGAMAAPFTVDGQEVSVSASVGIAASPHDGKDPAGLLGSANVALAQAVRDGGNGYRFCTGELAARSQRRFMLEQDLRHALAREEFVLHYQPRVVLPQGGLCGFEALLRWHNPRLGLIGPNEFISLAERSGAIVPIGEWVLLRACRQAQQWRDAGLDCEAMAVNVASRQLRSDSIVAAVRSALDESGLDPRALELEITESAVFEEADCLARLHRIKDLGVNISIDDIGTGYASLSRLKCFPFDRIKIDQSFMQDIDSDATSRAIAAAVMALARELGIPVLAEGVETEEQVNFLRDHLPAESKRGCEIQGFVYSEPLPADQCAVLLGAGRRLT